MAVKILHLADLHVGYVPGYLAPSGAKTRSDELKAAFRRAVDHAVDTRNTIRAVIVAGDLFDSHKPDHVTRGFVRGQLERLSSASIPALVVPGTHDGVGFPESVYKTETFPRGVQILAPPFANPPLSLPLDGEEFHFYWFTYEPGEKRTVAEYLETVKASPPARGHRIFIAHASVKGSPEWDMRHKDLPVSREELLSSGMQYVALGHYHNFDEFHSGSTTIVYPGTLEGKSFGENGPRYLVTAAFEKDGVRIEKQSFNVRALEERTLSLDSEAIGTEEELVRGISALARQDLLLKITLTGRSEFPVRPDFLAEAVRDKFFHIEIEDETSVLSAISTDAIEHEKTIRGMFVKRLKQAAASVPEDERAVHELALKEGLSAFAEKGIVEHPDNG